jgi:hypothetical protein
MSTNIRIGCATTVLLASAVEVETITRCPEKPGGHTMKG